MRPKIRVCNAYIAEGGIFTDDAGTTLRFKKEDCCLSTENWVKFLDALRENVYPPSR